MAQRHAALLVLCPEGANSARAWFACRSLRRVRRSAAEVSAGTTCLRRPGRHLAERRSRFLHHPALCRECRDAALQTFSITFKGRSFDESGSIAEIPRHFGSHHTEFDLDENADLEYAIEQMAYYSDEPSADAGALPAWFLAQMSRKDVTVVLTGEGPTNFLPAISHTKPTAMPLWRSRAPARSCAAPP